MDKFREEIHEILDKHPETYCGKVRAMVLDDNVSTIDFLKYVGLGTNLMLWVWGKGSMPTFMFKKYRELVAESGVRLFFNEVPSDSLPTDIVLVDEVSGLDFTGTKCKVVVKDMVATVGDNHVWGYGKAWVVGKGAADAIMDDESTFIGKSDKCGCETFGNAKFHGKGYHLHTERK